MFRLYAILLALGLIGATVGCHHTHGVCDCDGGNYGHEPPLLGAAVPPVPLLRPEPLQTMPKPVETAAASATTETPR